MRTDLELRHLRAFVTVVDLGSHTRAARALGVSQSTVSETLSSLERALGAVLFRKGARGAALTGSGEALLPYARRMLALSGEAVAALTAASAGARATLSVSAVESISTYVLPSRLAALRERWPSARLEVTMAACPEIRERVAAGKTDLGLVLEEAARGKDGGSALTRARLVVFGRPGHPLTQGRPSGEQLRRCDFYMSDAGGDYHHALRHHFEAAEVPPPRTQALGTVEGVKRGILAGGSALGLLPEHAVAQELDAGTLAEVRVHPALGWLVLRALRPSGGAGSLLADALLESLRGTPLVSGEGGARSRRLVPSGAR